MRCVLLSIATAAVLALTACGSDGPGGAKTPANTLTKAPPNAYPANVENNFMTNCERTSKGNTSGCRCILDELESTMSFAAFAREDQRVGKGLAPSRDFTKAVDRCR